MVMGIQNRWSIAYAIAEQMALAGGKLALTYIDERAGRDALALAGKYEGKGYICNVESDEDLDRLGHRSGTRFRADRRPGAFDRVCPGSRARGTLSGYEPPGFQVAMSISCYSLVAAAQRIAPLMTDGGSILTLTYLGAERAFPR